MGRGGTGHREHLLGQAARVLASPWPVLTATGYARFFTDGDRQPAAQGAVHLEISAT